MSTLYSRDYRLVVGNVDVTGLDIEFNVVKSKRSEPNKAKIGIYNLSPSRRSAIESGRNLRIELHAGYADPGAFLLFRGDVRTASTPKVSVDRDGTDYVTTIEAEDSGQSILQRRVSRSFPPGVQVVTVLIACIDALGIGRGNVTDFANQGLEGAGRTFPEGCTLSGWAFAETTNIVKSMGCTWSIQNGVFQGQVRGRPLQTSAVELSAQTGLIGTPSVDNKGVVKATALLMAGLDPGRIVSLRSEKITGGFEVAKVEFVGATSGDDWYANLEMRRY